MKSAKDWLVEEGFSSDSWYSPIKTDTGFSFPLHVTMERFANLRTYELQAAIFEFRKHLIHHQLLKEFDDRFGIKSYREGKLDE